MLRKDGSVIWVHDRGRVVRRDAQGRAVRVVGAYSDISERRQGQVALEEALLLAQSATRAKSEFLATMSHELRAPMNGVLGMAQLLTRPAVSEAQRVEYAQVILQSGETLLALLNDILDLSRVEAGRLEISTSTFSPAALVAEVLESYREPAARKGLPIVAVSSGVFDDQRLQCLEAGMDDFVGKPVVIEELVATLSRWCA